MQKLAIIFCLFSSLVSFGQMPVDTLDTPKGKMVIFSNRSWAYIADLDFDGVLNERLHNIIENDTNLQFVSFWDNEDCFTSNHQNDFSKILDSIKIDLVDTQHAAFVVPHRGATTSHYGPRGGRNHNGIDIDCETGDSIVSAWDGKVRYAMYNKGGFGNLVIVRHYNGLETLYAHLSEINVAPNQEVKAGDLLGLGGNTGASRGSHLHFEIRFYDGAINPEEMIDFEAKALKSQNLYVCKNLFRPGARPTDLDQHNHVEATASTASKAKKSSLAAKTHRVRAGETLSTIAAKNNTTVAVICKLNRIRKNSPIRAGKTIRVR